MTTKNRKNGYLPAACFNRTSRILIDDDGYFYKTREGDVVGSFATEAEARYDLNQFVEFVTLEKELQVLELLVAA